ncbi:hypothetical protein [Leucobacter chromiireducens]|uniref:Uncharacterized protein n=1 Tax=Leucobacter chromiireducens subsp. solipictus TaxID=398235 RepID=A0ABS1SDV1_9MICO|nr:hypothetical protein [Leucobacter chromiireducens]MBL3678561.1 hypothetical protein [Leucobacter chromiireducens subsp. solipictus]
MVELQRFDIWRQRMILTEIADNGSAVLSTAEGLAFIEQLHEFFAPPMLGIARSWGYDVERDEIVNMVLERLLVTRIDTERCPARYAAASETPWAYLWHCTLRWGQEMWGTRGVPLEHAEFMPAPSHMDEAVHTPLEEVVALTFALVSQVIESKYHDPVLELLGWLAANPPQRLSYDRDDRVAAHRFCPSLTNGQVTSVFKIARGSRPNTAETSLMGQFLLDANFRVSESGTHARALTHFKNEFRAAAAGPRDLADWT